LKRIFIQEDRDRNASGLMKNTKFIPGASKAEEKGKKAPKPKKEKENHFEFFSLRQVSTKRGIKRISSEKKKKWMKIWKA
jgi:hypothetical protein